MVNEDDAPHFFFAELSFATIQIEDDPHLNFLFSFLLSVIRVIKKVVVEAMGKNVKL